MCLFYDLAIKLFPEFHLNSLMNKRSGRGGWPQMKPSWPKHIRGKGIDIYPEPTL